MHTDSQGLKMSVWPWSTSSLVDDKLVWIGSRNSPYACTRSVC